MDQKQKPNWWLAFALMPLMLVLLVIESQQPSPVIEHRVLEIAIVIFTFSLLALWVRANQAGLVNEEMEQEKWCLARDPKVVSSVELILPSADDCADSKDSATELEFGSSHGRNN